MSAPNVTEKDLQDLFSVVVKDLASVIRSGDATGKDKELAIKLIDSFSIGLTLKEAEPLMDLAEELPFTEMRPQ